MRRRRIAPGLPVELYQPRGVETVDPVMFGQMARQRAQVAALGDPVGNADLVRRDRPPSRRGARTQQVSAGQSGALGECRWRALWPKPRDPVYPAGNDASVVLDVTGCRVPDAISVS